MDPSAQHTFIEPQIHGNLAYWFFPFLGQRHCFRFESLRVHAPFYTFLSYLYPLLALYFSLIFLYIYWG
jgi:hypothetical protein